MISKRRLLAKLACLVALSVILSSCISAEIRRVRAMPINEIDLRNVKDGAYTGAFAYGGFSYEVEVSIKDHQYETIRIAKNRDTKHAKKAEGVIPRVLEKQSLQVDAVAGATTTSKALLKAIENALSANK